MADPIQPREKIAEAEPPADRRRIPYSAPVAGSGAVDQPDQGREREEQDRPKIDGRHREPGQRAGGERDQPAPPSPGQYDGVDRTLRFHEAGDEVGFCRVTSSREAAGFAIAGFTNV